MSFVRDGLALVGVSLVLWGLAQWSLPLSVVTGGVVLLGCAFGWSAMKGKA
jgi:hypothetical protein